MSATYEDLERLGSILPDVDYPKMVKEYGTTVFDVMRAFYAEAKATIARQLQQSEHVITRRDKVYTFTLGPNNGEIKVEYRDDQNQMVTLIGEDAADLLDQLVRPARI